MAGDMLCLGGHAAFSIGVYYDHEIRRATVYRPCGFTTFRIPKAIVHASQSSYCSTQRLPALSGRAEATERDAGIGASFCRRQLI